MIKIDLKEDRKFVADISSEITLEAKDEINQRINELHKESYSIISKDRKIKKKDF